MTTSPPPLPVRRSARSSGTSRPTSPAGRPRRGPGVTTYKLSSNENPYPPLPGVLEAARRGGRPDEPLPGHGLHRAVRRARRPARRAGRRTSPRAPGRWPCSTTCCRRSASPATRSSTPGAPSRPTRSRSRSPAPRRVQVPLTADARHDLDAMAAAVTDRTKVVIVCTPEQPDRPGGHARPSSRRSSTQVPVARAGGARRGLPRVRPRSTTRSTALDVYRARTPTSSRCAPSPRPTGWPASGSGTPSRPSRSRPRVRALRAAVRRLVGRPGRGGRVAGRARPSCSSGSRRSSPSATRVVDARCATQGWDVPDAQGNFVWLAARRPDRRLRRRRRARPGSWCGRSPARAPGSRIGEPAGNDVLLEVAAAFRA